MRTLSQPCALPKFTQVVALGVGFGALSGCRPLPEAPMELDELCGYLFEHANDDDDTLALEAGAINLDAWLDVNIDATIEGYSVNTLSDDSVNALNDGERSLDGVKGAAVGHTSEYAITDLVSALVGDDMMAIYPDNYETFSRTFDDDPACFLAGDCVALQAETFSTIDYSVVTVEVDSMVQYRWVETADYGRVAIERTWMRTPATVSLDFLSVDQQYYVWMFIPGVDGSGSRSIQATWMVAQLGSGAPPEDVVLGIVVNSMSKGADDLDGWLATK
jgi:hypothetical protein